LAEQALAQPLVALGGVEQPSNACATVPHCWRMRIASSANFGSRSWWLSRKAAQATGPHAPVLPTISS
jgi:hypothetical protein